MNVVPYALSQPLDKAVGMLGAAVASIWGF